MLIASTLGNVIILKFLILNQIFDLFDFLSLVRIWAVLLCFLQQFLPNLARVMYMEPKIIK